MSLRIILALILLLAGVASGEMPKVGDHACIFQDPEFNSGRTIVGEVNDINTTFGMLTVRAKEIVVANNAMNDTPPVNVTIAIPTIDMYWCDCF